MFSEKLSTYDRITSLVCSALESDNPEKLVSILEENYEDYFNEFKKYNFFLCDKIVSGNNKKILLYLINNSYDHFLSYYNLIMRTIYYLNFDLFRIIFEADKLPSIYMLMSIVLKHCDITFLKYLLDEGFKVKPIEFVDFGLQSHKTDDFIQKMKLILLYGADINTKMSEEDSTSHTILSTTIHSGSIESIKFLLQNGAIVTYEHLETASFKSFPIFKLIHDQCTWNTTELKPIFKNTLKNNQRIYQFLIETYDLEE